MDLSLTCVVATQLWHHIYLGGGLCELPTWEHAAPPRGVGSTELGLSVNSGRPAYSEVARAT